MVVRTPRKTRINNRYSWFYYLFLPDFQFRNLRKINKDHGSIEWKWWIFVSCYLQSCFFFRHVQAVFQTLFHHFFFLHKNKLKNGIWRADYLTRKLKWKFDIRESWLVTLLVREPCQKPLLPTPPSPLKTFSSINSEIRIVWGSSINRRKKFNFNDRSNQIEKFFTIENDPEK